MKISILGSTSRGLLVRLIIVHCLGTIFAYTVYVKLSSLGDAFGYAQDSFIGFDEGLFIATTLVYAIYHFLGTVLPGFLPPMALGLVVAILTWHAFRDVYVYTNRKLFWVCNLLPHFLVWSGSSSKEQIVIICGIIVINFGAKRSFASSKLSINIIFVFLALWLIYFIRPNYFVIYLTIFLTSLFSPWLNKLIIRRLSVGLWILPFMLSTAIVTFYLYQTGTFFSEDVVRFMHKVQQGFLAYTTAGSNRTNIQWNDISDFMFNSLWAIPQGFIGPTLFEIISKPIQIPAFLEGLIFISIVTYLFIKLLQLISVSRSLRVHILPYMFVGFVIVFISYPYLMFNPGSALRYKQAMHPILIFYPLLILAYYRASQLLKVKVNKISN